MMDDRTLLALCIWSEASGEPLAGKQAVAQVILNRMHARYQSDGTVLGTVLHPNAFSGFWFVFQGKSYVRACRTLSDAQARAGIMLVTAEKTGVWPECVKVADDALAGTLPAAPKLEHAVSYLNPRILNGLPIWADPAKLVASVGHHDFYRA